ncbi:MAG: branched-chain amino acid ABC transporter permease [Ruminiclostridium sp.]|nr:branched-chain amino acid ABC transporter permease [Ruminiclostridium sp.]
MRNKKPMSPASRSAFINYGIVIVAFVVIQVLLGQGILSNTLQSLLVPVCCYIVMAVSLNLTVGVLGELSLGHAGFMSLGAFSGIIVSFALKDVIAFGPLVLVISILVGAVIGGIGGVLIGVPVLRLRGDYLAIVTLAFGEIIKNVIMVLYVGLDENGLHFATSQSNLNMAYEGTAIIKGPMGAVGVTRLATFTAGFILVLVTLVIVQNLVNSRAGRAILALRDNRIAAESVGISVTKYKLMAFVTSAALAGAAGALFGLNYSSTMATRFDFNTSILILVFVVLGGLGSIRGSMIAAALLYILPEMLRSFAISEYRMLIYAIILILVMLFTNNPQLKELVGKIVPKKAKKGGEANG